MLKLRFLDRLEQQVVIGKESVDQLTQEILAKAFRVEMMPTEAELVRLEGREYKSVKFLLERVKGNKRDK